MAPKVVSAGDDGSKTDILNNSHRWREVQAVKQMAKINSENQGKEPLIRKNFKVILNRMCKGAWKELDTI